MDSPPWATWQWNANGTLQQLAITDPFNSADNQTCTYSYDDLARLGGTNCGSVWAQTFSYDPFGNVSKSGSISWLPNYASPINNQYQAGWQGLNGKVSYDANGNLLNDTFNAYTWDVYGKLASANGAAIAYDAFGRMVENHSGTYQFVYAPNGGKQPLAEMQGQSLLGTFLPLPGGAIAAYNSSGLNQYMHADWLGSARLSSTPSRVAIPDLAYGPFGEGYAGGQQYEQFTGINAGTVDDTENQTGSLEDFMFRRYSPVQGRWISPDPAGLGAVDPSNPQSWNRYAYVLNNPLALIDPLGLVWLEACVQVNGGPQECDWTWEDGGDGGGPAQNPGGGPFGGGGGGGGTGGANNFTLGIRAPGQTWSQCMAANANTYSIGGAFELTANVATGTSSNISQTTSIVTGNGITGLIFEGPGAGDFLNAAGNGAGSALTYGRRTSDIMSLNLAGTGGLPQALGSTGAQGFFETAGQWLNLGLDEAEKFGVDAGLAGAEAFNCAIQR